MVNKGLIWSVIIASRINLFAGAIFLHGRICNMYRVYFLNYILNERGVKVKRTNFLTRVLQQNEFFNKRIPIIRCFQTHCQLSKFTILDMLFKTKLTSLVNTRGLTDNASLKIIRILAVTLGAITVASISQLLWKIDAISRQHSHRHVLIGNNIT